MASGPENQPDDHPEDQPGTSAETTETPEIICKYKQLKKVQFFLQLKALKTLGENLQTEDDGKMFLERVKRVPSITNAIKQLIDEIQTANPEEEHDSESLEILEQLCARINAQANAVREELGTRSYHHPRKSKVKHLPHLSLPTFSGELEDWPAFKKSYEKMIHNNEDLSAQDKIKYLIACVRGDAVSLTEGVSPIGTNYQCLWQSLERKFHNKRIMADSHLSELLSMEPKADHNLQTLNSFLENFHSKVRALEGLYIPDLADYFLSYLAYSKLPADTKMLFDETHRRSKFFSYDELIEFVESEKAKCMRVTKKTKKKQLSLVNTNELVLSQATFCILCTDGKHPLNTCPKFRQMTTARRWIVVKQFKRCPNCLKYHGKKTCMSRATCTTCNRKHHHLLHQEKQGESGLGDDQPEDQMDPVPSTSNADMDALEGAQEDIPPVEESKEESPEPGTSEELPQPAKTTEALPLPPKTTEALPQPSKTAEALPLPSKTAEALPQPPKTAEALPLPPKTAEALPQPPKTAEALPQPPKTAEALPQPPKTPAAETKPRPTILIDPSCLTNCTFSPDRSNFFFNLENLTLPIKKKDGEDGKNSKGKDDSSEGSTDFIVRKLSIEVKKL